MDPMPTYCAWCGRHMSGPRPGSYDGPLSHGICSGCANEVKRKLAERLSQDERTTYDA